MVSDAEVISVVSRAMASYCPRLPSWVDFDDYRQAASEACLRARVKYRPELGVSFWVFAWPRVYGAMQDLTRQTTGRRTLGYDHLPVSLDLLVEQHDDEADTLRVLEDPRGSVEEIAERRDTIRRSLRVLSELTPQQRGSFRATLADRQLEYARENGITAAAASHAAARARKWMREAVAA